MAVKGKAQKRKVAKIEDINDGEIQEFSAPVTVENKRKMSWLGWAGIVFAVLCVYWWKTNNWPIIAIVGTKPVLRYTVNQELYKQSGKAMVNSLVTEKLIENEIAKSKSKPTEMEIDNKLQEIKAGFASEDDFNSALTERSMSMTELRQQIGLQLGIEKILEDRIEVTASDAAAFVAEMGTLMTASDEAGQMEEAKDIIRNQKLQMEINSWVEEIRAKGKVWWIGRV